MVERNLAKVEVASSSLVSRSSMFDETSVCRGFVFSSHRYMAWWQSGYAAACKAVYAGSIPTQASIAESSKATHRSVAFFVPRRVTFWRVVSTLQPTDEQ